MAIRFPFTSSANCKNPMFPTSPASGTSFPSSLTPDPHHTPGLASVYQCLSSTERAPKNGRSVADTASQTFNREEQSLPLNCCLESY